MREPGFDPFLSSEPDEPTSKSTRQVVKNIRRIERVIVPRWEAKRPLLTGERNRFPFLPSYKSGSDASLPQNSLGRFSHQALSSSLLNMPVCCCSAHSLSSVHSFVLLT